MEDDKSTTDEIEVPTEPSTDEQPPEQPESESDEINNYFDTVFSDMGTENQEDPAKNVQVHNSGNYQPPIPSSKRTQAQQLLSEYGLNSYEELEELRTQNLGLYHEITSELAMQKLQAKNEERYQDMQIGLAIQNVLNIAKSQGYNPDDVVAHARYFGMPVSDRSFELFKNMKQQSKAKMMPHIDKLAKIQKETKPPVQGSTPPNTGIPDYVKEGLKIAKAI
jgi:hypothetical protein